MNRHPTPPTVEPAKAVTRRGSSPPTSDAQRRAVVILEVLSGVRSAGQGAAALGISVNHYYLLERQALGGLVAACAPRPKGQRSDQQRQLRRLEQALERSQRDCQRQAALVRATQRAVGLSVTPAPTATATTRRGKASSARGPRRRRTSVRALRMARRLTPERLAQEEPVVVQPTVIGDNSLSAQEEHSDGATRT